VGGVERVESRVEARAACGIFRVMRGTRKDGKKKERRSEDKEQMPNQRKEGLDFFDLQSDHQQTRRGLEGEWVGSREWADEARRKGRKNATAFNTTPSNPVGRGR